MRTSLLAAAAAALGPGLWNAEALADGQCGIATNMLDHNDAGMTTFCTTGLKFWWNWNFAPQSTYSAACALPTFVPMIWGVSPDDPKIAAGDKPYGHLMGYNEPDHWAPPPYPGAQCLSAGTFSVNFHCGSSELATNWQATVLAYLQANPGGRVVSPAMADATGSASVGEFAACNTADQTEQHCGMPDCPGWLKCFKENVIKYQCGSTNCWDVISVIQFHAYYYEASNLISKVKLWESAWAEDLVGANGRSKKTLWLTEFAHAGTTDSSDPDGAAGEFIQQSVAYLKQSPYVSGWSWFSQDNSTFASFTINGRKPTAPYWASDLIDKTGKLTVIGQEYKSACGAGQSELLI